MKKIINKFKMKKRIIEINKKTNSEISSRAFINDQSQFEGNNIIFKNTNLSGSKLGLLSYIGSDCFLINSLIGRFCSIGNDVKVVVGNHPTRKYVSTHPLSYSKREFSGISISDENYFEEYSYIDKEKKFFISIGNDVWIGNEVKIVNGVKIGDGAIIGTGAVVTKDIPPYAIVGGVPAKLIRYRFDRDKINFLLDLKWWEKDIAILKSNKDLFRDIDSFLNLK